MNKSKKTITLAGTQKPFLCRDENLTMYYNDIRKYEVLTQEETTELFKLFQNGTPEEKEYAKNELFNHNARLVASMARQYCTANDNLMDLIQEGNIGLLRAIEKFSFDKESSFQKFAMFHIRRDINLFKTNYTPIVQQTNRSKTDSVLKTIVSDFIQKEHREPTADEILEAYNESNGNKPIDNKDDMVSVEYVFIDSLEPKDGEIVDAQDYLDYSEKSCSYNDYLFDVEQNHNKEIINVLMNGLTPKEKQAISLFYGLEDGLTNSLSSIGTIMGCTSERARQLIKVATEKMTKKASNLSYCH